MPASPGPVFHEIPRKNLPTDVSLIPAPAPPFEKLLRICEDDRAARLDRIHELLADRDSWITRYNAADVDRLALMTERGKLESERGTLIAARDTLTLQNAALKRKIETMHGEHKADLEQYDIALGHGEAARRKLNALKRFSPWRLLPSRLRILIARWAGL